jgi:hypothetical protein
MRLTVRLAIVLLPAILGSLPTQAVPLPWWGELRPPQTTTRPFTPIRIRNGANEPLLVVLVGPTLKTLKLGPTSAEVVTVLPGEYECLYSFGGNVAEDDMFKKTEKFKVTPWDGRPHLVVEVWADITNRSDKDPDRRSIHTVFPASAKEFNEAKARTASASGVAGRIETSPAVEQRINELNVIVKIGDVQYAETPSEIARQKRLVFGYVNQYVTTLLLPKLRSRGIKVTYLGLREDVPEVSNESRLIVDYSEFEGDRYSRDPDMTEATAVGVNISCELRLEHPGFEGDLVWEANFLGVNDAYFNMGVRNEERALHLNALQSLRSQFKTLTIELADWAPKSGGSSNSPSSAGKPRKSTSGTRRVKPGVE